jgi:hypothetical protein
LRLGLLLRRRGKRQKQRCRDRSQQGSSHASHPWPPLRCAGLARSRRASRVRGAGAPRVQRIIPLFR